jgi:aromatic ring hydroxylase
MVARTKDKTSGDGRQVYLYGDRINDVTTHPAFRKPVRMTARLPPFESAQLDGLTARASCHESAEPYGRRTPT